MRGALGRRGSSWAPTGASKILQKTLPMEGNFCPVLWGKVQVAGCWVWGFFTVHTVQKKPLSLWLRFPQKPGSPWEELGGGGKEWPGQDPVLLDLAGAALNGAGQGRR